MKTIAVLGANGRLSNMVAKSFHASGYEVIAITRSGNAKGLPAGIQTRAADALDGQALIRATEGAEIVFNGLNPPYTAWSKQVMPMGKNVMQAAAQHGAIHLFPGNVYSYGNRIPALVDEKSAFDGTTRKGAIRIQLEALFEDYAVRKGVHTTILRAGDFFGGSLTGSWFDLVVASKIGKRTFTYPGPLDCPHSWAYLPDLAATFVALAGCLDALETFDTLLFPGHTFTGGELKNHCETAVGHGLGNAGIPWPLLRLGGVVMPMWREISEMAYLWRVPHQLNGDRLQALIGTVPHTDPRVAVGQALTDLGVGLQADRVHGLPRPA